MHIAECWCSNCSIGQMEIINKIIFENHMTYKQMVGQEITCDKCGHKNIIEDLLSMIPTSYLVASKNKTSLKKSNEDLLNWLTVD